MYPSLSFPTLFRIHADDDDDDNDNDLSGIRGGKHDTNKSYPDVVCAMSAAATGATSSELTKCSNCSDTYFNGTLYPCGYALCKKCLETTTTTTTRLNEKGHFVCPKCSAHHNKTTHMQMRTGSLSATAEHVEASRSPPPLPPPPPQTASAMVYDDRSLAELRNRLDAYYRVVEGKMDLVNNLTTIARFNVEKECRQVSAEIDEAVCELVRLIEHKRSVMLRDVDAAKTDLMIAINERYENNDAAVHFKHELNRSFKSLVREMAGGNNKSEDTMRSLVEKLSALNSRIDDNRKYIPADLCAGITFTKATTTTTSDNKSAPATAAVVIDTLIGDINYECVYKSDMLGKIRNLNNKFQHRCIELAPVLAADLPTISKEVAVLSKNKLLLIYQKLFGKIKSLFVKVVYYDGSVLREIEIKNVGVFHAHVVHARTLLLLFKKSKRDYVLQRYDMFLKLERELAIEYEVSAVLMNESRIFLVRERSGRAADDCVYEYDCDLRFVDAFGQVKSRRAPYYVRGDIFAICNEKIYVKHESEIRLVSRTSGELLVAYEVLSENLKNVKIFLDNNKEKYVLFNRFNKISYLNHKGELIGENKLRDSDFYDDFQYTKSGHFAFVDYKRDTVLIL